MYLLPLRGVGGVEGPIEAATRVTLDGRLHSYATCKGGMLE